MQLRLQSFNSRDLPCPIKLSTNIYCSCVQLHPLSPMIQLELECECNVRVPGSRTIRSVMVGLGNITQCSGWDLYARMHAEAHASAFVTGTKVSEKQHGSTTVHGMES